MSGRRAAEKGLAMAQTNVADMFANGRGTTRNFADACRWYAKAAAQGDEVGLSRLEDCRRSGYER